MKKGLRFVCVLLLASIFFSNLFGVTAYSAGNKVTVKVGSNYSDRTNEVKIPVSLSDLPDYGLSGMNFTLQFDDGLIFKDLTKGDLISDIKDLSYSIKDNKINILYSDMTGGDNPIKTAGVLCYISFTVSSNSFKSSYTVKRIVSSNEKLIDKYLSNIEPTYVDGAVTIKDSMYRVATNKKWQVTFSKEISPSSLINNSIEVKDANGENVSCSFSVTNGGKTLEITAPTGGYKLYNSYTVTIKDTFVSSTGRKLSKEQKINFYIDR